MKDSLVVKALVLVISWFGSNLAKDIWEFFFLKWSKKLGYNQ